VFSRGVDPDYPFMGIHVMDDDRGGKIGDRNASTFEIVLIIALMLVCSTIGPGGPLFLLIAAAVLIGFGIYRACCWVVAYRPWEHLPALPGGDIHALRGLVLVALGMFLIPIAMTSSYVVCRWMLAWLRDELWMPPPEMIEEFKAHEKSKGWRERIREADAYWYDDY
jgi:hypothetical protein